MLNLLYVIALGVTSNKKTPSLHVMSWILMNIYVMSKWKNSTWVLSFQTRQNYSSWLWLDPRSHHRRLFWLNRNVKLGLCESSLILRLGPCPGCLCAQLKQRGSGALRQIFIHFNIHSFQDLKWWNEINASGVNDFIEIDLRIVRTRNSMSHSCCVGYYL